MAIAGLPALGLAAAHGLGIPFDRIVLIPRLGRDKAAEVIAALADGFDVVIVDPRLGVGPRDSRRLVARLRDRGGVVLVAGGDLPGSVSAVRLQVISAAWEGLETVGHLQRCRALVETTGRGAAAQMRRSELWLPGHDGLVATAGAPGQAVTGRRVG